MCADLPQHVACVDVPQFEKTPTASTQETVASRHEGEATDPVFVRIVDGLQEEHSE